MQYKKTLIRCTAILMAASVTAFSLLGIVSFGEDIKDNDDITIYHIVPDGEPSEYGLVNYKIVDSEGNEFKLPEITGDNMFEELGSANEGLLPAYFNLCDEGRVTSVKNQNPYGTCWAHSALASAESNMITKGYADQSVDYSEKHLVWFTQGDCSEYQSPDDPTYGDTFTWGSDYDPYANGAYPYRPVATLGAWKGAELEENVPYDTIGDGYMVDESKRYDSYAHLQNTINIDYYSFDKEKVNEIKRLLINNGALSCSYFESEAFYNFATHGYYNNMDTGSGHAVTIVGWDDNYSADNFVTQAPGSGAWIMKNSWDTDWGDSGYFYMSYYDSSLHDIYSYNMEASDNYDNIYQYSGDRNNVIVGSKKYMTAANVFTAKGNEKLRAVSFNTSNVNENDYLIRIYTDVQKGDPTSGKLIHTQRGVTPIYTDYVTVELDKDVYLTENTRYTVAVTYDSAKSFWLYADTHCYAEDTSYYYLGDTEELGEMTDCITYSDEYGNKMGNFIIRAFTDNYAGVGETRLSVNNFPDNSFRSIVSTYDINNDGILSDAENAAVTELNIDGRGIKRLDGIENLTYLQKLSCRENELRSIDVSSLSSLTELHCDRNKLTAVNLEGTSVNIFTAAENAADIGSIKDYYSLYLLDRYGFDYTKADNWQGAEYDPDYIILENIAADKNTVTYSYDCGNGFTADFSLCYTDAVNGLAIDSINFPDDNFRSYVKKFDLNSDGKLSIPEREAVTEINVDNMNINSLVGLDLFSNLYSLSFNNNNITYFPIEYFNNLMSLSFDDNNISVPINIEYDSKLTYLSCKNNNIPFVNIHKTMEYYADGNVYDLGVVGSKYVILDFMRDRFDENRVLSIDGAKLEFNMNNYNESYFYDIGGDESGSFTMEYDCAWNNIGTTFTFKYEKINVTVDEEHFPDKVLRDYISEKFDENSDGVLNTDEILNAKSIDLSLTDENDTSHEKLKKIDGIEYLPFLRSMSCNNNAVETADLSKNAEMRIFWCRNNNMSSIDLTGCNNLHELDVMNNNLEHIDLSDTSNLVFLSCSNNPLQELKTGDLDKQLVITAENTSVKYIDVSGSNVGMIYCCNSPELEYVNANNCPVIYNITLDNCPKLTEVKIDGIKSFKQFHIANAPNLTGKIDLSGNVALFDSGIHHTGVEEIDISGTGLTCLLANSNKLKALRADNCNKLEALYCYENNLESLAIVSSTIKTIDCSNNNIASIDVSECPALETLICHDNKLDSLDVSGCTALEILSFGNNNIKSIDVSGCTNLSEFSCYNNPLVCLDVSNTKVTDYYDILAPFETSRKEVYSLDLLSAFGFDPSKASEWEGAVYNAESNTLTDFTSDTVTYKYDCGNNICLTFSIYFTSVESGQITINDIDKMSHEQLTGYVNNVISEGCSDGKDAIYITDVSVYAITKLLEIDKAA